MGWASEGPYMGSASLVPRSSLKSRRGTGALHDRYLLLHGERPYRIKNGIPYCRMYSLATDKTSMMEVQMVPSCVGQSALLLSSCIHLQQESCFYFEPGTQVCPQLHVQGMLFLTWESCDVSWDRRDGAAREFKPILLTASLVPRLLSSICHILYKHRERTWKISSYVQWHTMYSFMCGFGNWIIAHARLLWPCASSTMLR